MRDLVRRHRGGPLEAAGWWVVVTVGHLVVLLATRTEATFGHWGGAGGDYLAIAREGYRYQEMRLAWFPGFPIAVRAVSALGFDVDDAGVLIAVVCGAMAAVALWDWATSLDFGLVERRLTVLALLCSPGGFLLLGVPYTEALFLALGIGAAAAVERRRPGLAALLLAGASLTRFTGVILAVGLAVRSLHRDGVLLIRRPRPGFDGTRLRASQLLPLAGVAGAASYFAYCAVVHDDAWIYFRKQNTMTPTMPFLDPRTWVHWSVVANLRSTFDAPNYLIGILLGGLLTVATVSAIPAVWRRVDPGYAVIVAGVVIFIWFGAWDFPSVPRYLLAAFPVAAVIGRAAAARRASAVGWLAGSTVLMLVLATMFHHDQSLITW